ncbi:MAG: hypothetical protein KF861_07655 [Planctomycetaceae bacterium]|nr:hypothetical protein [Planctomycetaceae bacterium]
MSVYLKNWLTQSRRNGKRLSQLMVLLVVAALPLSLMGCRDSSSYGNRVPLSGTVTKGGQPLDIKATIYFDPLPGATGVGSSGEVSQSKFSIPVESGPTPGVSYKVTVLTAPGIPADGTPRDQIRLPERLEKTVEIPATPEKGAELIIDFE